MLWGLDGAKGGWAAARWDGETLEVSFLKSLELLKPAAEDTVVIDMPIGLPASGPRACDLEAAQSLGPRRASIFPAPIRPALEGEFHSQASGIQQAIDGRGISIQAYHLFPKIIEVDNWLDSAPCPVVEGHPELALAQLRGGPLPFSKHTPEGRQLRLDLLSEAFPSADIPAMLEARHRQIKPDDFLDACVLIVTAQRFAAGEATELGDGARDEYDRPMRIVF